MSRPWMWGRSTLWQSPVPGTRLQFVGAYFNLGPIKIRIPSTEGDRSFVRGPEDPPRPLSHHPRRCPCPAHGGTR